MTIDTAALAVRLQRALGDSLQVGEVLGVGGFAAVYRARDPFLERDVAIKVLDPSLALTEEREAGFLHEARIVAGVEHPHIVPLYDAAARDGLLYLVMRLLPGQSLADRLAAERKLAPAEAARLAHETAMALAVAHERGVVHRDIKPDNILLDGSGHATVTDFGISRVTGRSAAEVSGASIGTPAYMSPEQALGEEVDGRADVYSLGVTLFEMLSGKRPYEGRSLTELMAKIISAPPPIVASLEPSTPTALASLVTRMLAKEREQRPSSAEVVTLLADARTPDALLTPAQAARKKRRRRLTIAGVAVGSAVAVLYGVWRVAAFAFRFLLSDPGAEPTIFTDVAHIPPTLLAAVRADGTLRPNEPVKLVFIPGGHTEREAAFFTDSFVVRRSPSGPRRVRLTGADLHVSRSKQPPDMVLRGYLIISRGAAASDTLYDDLGGLDVTRLLMSLYAKRGELGSTKP